MRIRYIGRDNRTRVVVASSVKFLSDGFKATDKKDEMDDSLHGPMLVIHISRNKGGKRLTLQVPDDFNMEDAKGHLLEKGWIDFSACTLKMENLY